MLGNQSQPWVVYTQGWFIFSLRCSLQLRIRKRFASEPKKQVTA